MYNLEKIFLQCKKVKLVCFIIFCKVYSSTFICIFDKIILYFMRAKSGQMKAVVLVVLIVIECGNAELLSGSCVC